MLHTRVLLCFTRFSSLQLRRQIELILLTMKRLNYLLIALLASFGVAGAAASSASGFDWQAIEPSAKLIYHKCYQEYKCARLLLPLNWLNETDKRTVAIAITKLPAVVEDDAKSFAGTIFAQPGGPAASGTRYQRRIGHKIQQLVDIPDKKHYEILSFDLRGTGQSEPRINCFPGILNYVRNMQNLINGPLNTSPAALALALASAKADAWQCETVHGDFLSHVSTASIARDMLAILDQVEEMRQKHFSRNDQKLPNSSDAPARMELRSSENATGSITGVPRLKYWGISYGTFIGQTFASMFPGRVGRMIVDGVMDADDIVHEMVSQISTHLQDARLRTSGRIRLMAGSRGGYIILRIRTRLWTHFSRGASLLVSLDAPYAAKPTPRGSMSVADSGLGRKV